MYYSRKNFLIALHKNPDLIHEMFKFWTDFIIERSKPLVENAKIDYASVTEDMAYTNGPHISPTQYRKFMLPHHRRLTSFLEEHGIDIIMLDCSGNINVMMTPNKKQRM